MCVGVHFLQCTTIIVLASFRFGGTAEEVYQVQLHEVCMMFDAKIAEIFIQIPSKLPLKT